MLKRRWARSLFRVFSVVLLIGISFFLRDHTSSLSYALPNPNPPAYPVRLIFIHHSTGENWLADENGELGIALRDNNYFASDTNYGWGPDSIGDNTDIGHWWSWFRGPNSSTYLNALYGEGDQHASYSRLSSAPSGENEIVMFKSCFPNSALQGSPSDSIPPIGSNPLKEEGAGSEHHTVANAKGIYIDILEYFRSRQDKLFIVITAPPLSDDTYADNARTFNNWLVNDWLNGYSHPNVFVFDFYNILTTNGGNRNVNDLDQEGGNHHRWWNSAIQHKVDGDNDSNPNVSEYASSSNDDHPSRAGNLKATGEFLNLLNIAYHNWRGEESPPVTETVSTPWPPSGPTSGSPWMEYIYSTGGSTSSLGHPVQYHIDWGDGTNSEWLDIGVNSASKSWDGGGSYAVMVQARCAIHPSVVSSWSSVLTVTIISNEGPDLTGEWVSLNTTCKDTKSGTKCKVQGTLNIRNIGNQDAWSTSVNFYLSEDGEYDEEDTFLKSVSTGTIKTEGSKNKKLSYSFQAGEDVRDKYIIAVIDEDHYLEELDETNNVIVYGPM